MSKKEIDFIEVPIRIYNKEMAELLGDNAQVEERDSVMIIRRSEISHFKPFEDEAGNMMRVAVYMKNAENFIVYWELEKFKKEVFK